MARGNLGWPESQWLRKRKVRRTGQVGPQLPFLRDRTSLMASRSAGPAPATHAQALGARPCHTSPDLQAAAALPILTATPGTTFLNPPSLAAVMHMNVLVLLKSRAAAYTITAADSLAGHHHSKAYHSPRKRALWAMNAINSLHRMTSDSVYSGTQEFVLWEERRGQQKFMRLG